MTSMGRHRVTHLVVPLLLLLACGSADAKSAAGRTAASASGGLAQNAGGIVLGTVQGHVVDTSPRALKARRVCRKLTKPA